MPYSRFELDDMLALLAAEMPVLLKGHRTFENQFKARAAEILDYTSDEDQDYVVWLLETIETQAKRL